MKLAVEFTADDGGYHTTSSVCSEYAATLACKKWCERHGVKFDGLRNYELNDDDGFFYSFSVAEVAVGVTISTGQWR